MAAGIENVFEDESIRVQRPTFGHASIEINAHCPFATSKACGDRCVLVARRAPTSHLLNLNEIREAFNEILDCGPEIRHFGVPGMEPLASPEVLFELLGLFHDRGVDQRPVTFNMITSGINLDRFVSRFRALPLDALIISVDDTVSTGLRVVGAGENAHSAALSVRDAGGSNRLCVNSLLTNANSDAVLSIAKQLRDVGIDQMLVSPLRKPIMDNLVATISQAELLAFAHRAANTRAIAGLSILVEVEIETILATAGENVLLRSAGKDWSTRWRIGDSSVSLMAVDPTAPFVRIRWDGQLMNRSDLFRVNLARTSAGRYEAGIIRKHFSSPTSLEPLEACLA